MGVLYLYEARFRLVFGTLSVSATILVPLGRYAIILLQGMLELAAGLYPQSSTRHWLRLRRYLSRGALFPSLASAFRELLNKGVH